MSKVKIIYEPIEDEDGKYVTFRAVTYSSDEQEKIYKKVSDLIGSHQDREYARQTAKEVADWCETAVSGETYDFGPGEVVIFE